VIGDGPTITFTEPVAIYNFLPQLSVGGVLTGNLQDPQSSSAGELAGEILALSINVDFSAASVLTSATPLGGLTSCNFAALPLLNGTTVNQFLITANHIMSTGNGPFGVDTATSVARVINAAFADGTPSAFAQNSLVNGACQSSVVRLRVKKGISPIIAIL
jgi:hypothetical protein